MRITAATTDEAIVACTLRGLEEEYQFQAPCFRGRAYLRWDVTTQDAGFCVCFRQLLAERLHAFEKYRCLLHHVHGFRDEYRLHALLGAMIAVDCAGEREELVRRMGRHVSLPQIKLFTMDRLYETWQVFASFASAFCDTEPSEHEAFSALLPVMHLLGAQGEEGAVRRVILNGAHGTLSAGGHDVPVLPLSGQEDLDVIVALTALRPDTVTITNPKRLSKQVFALLQEMGEAARAPVNNS